MNARLAQTIGLGLITVPLFFVVFDAAINLMEIAPVEHSIIRFWYPLSLAFAGTLLWGGSFVREGRRRTLVGLR